MPPDPWCGAVYSPVFAFASTIVALQRPLTASSADPVAPQVVPSKRVVVARATDTKDSVDVDKLVSDLQAKVRVCMRAQMI